jgi:signal transduction histidine kinase
MSIRLKLFTGFLFLIVIFLVSFLVNQRMSREVLRNSEYINRSESLIRNSNRLHKYIIDMQSGYRGYLLTGQEDFLEPYYVGLKSVPPLFREQYKLLDSPVQKQRLDTIAKLHAKWIDYANSLISTKKDTLPEASERYRVLFEIKVRSGTGKVLNDKIRDVFTEMESLEYKVRQERRQKLQASIDSTRQINLTLTLCSIVLALIASYYIIRIITRRIAKMVNLADEISKGNFRKMVDDKNDELTRLSESLNTMSSILHRNFQDLTQKNKELDQFAYVVSHDLKAPLRGIDNIVTWTEEDHGNELTPAVKKNIEVIKGRARRLENMINGLREYARIGRVRKELEEVDVNVLLKEIVELLVPEYFEVQIGSNMPVLYTEKIRLEQVFSNLISNAVKYNDKEKGEIRISCVKQADHYEFRVSDNGIGIQSEYFEKIFTIFQTLRERDAFESTGVGLAIVKRIIENKHATIRVESIFGKGSSFIFTWPLHPDKRESGINNGQHEKNPAG